MSLALSTSWNAFRYTDGNKIISEIKNLGFDEVELSFDLTAGIIKDIAKLISRKSLKVSSLHNYCPIPTDVPRHLALPDCYSMASIDQQEREKAVKFTKSTIDTAASLGAKVVVLHCGRVEIPDKTRSLINLCTPGIKSTEEFNRIKNDYVQLRQITAKPFFENTLKSLDELNLYAKNKDILLGVENRFYLREIPSFEELGIILGTFKGSNIYYWHDTGHAVINEQLGFNMPNQLLNTFSENIIGAHLHDVKSYHDHLAPLQGELDFKLINSYFRKDTIRVIEAHYPAPAQSIKEAKEGLERLFNEYVSH